MCPLPHYNPKTQRKLRLREVQCLPSGPHLWEGDASKWLGRKGLSGASLGAPCSPACPPGMSHGSAEQCVEGRAGAGAKISTKSRMEDCWGQRQPCSGEGGTWRKGGP